MSPELSGQVALVTGAGRGIGAEISREFARAGCHVALVELGAFNEAQSLAAELCQSGTRAVAIRADVSDFGAAEETVASAVQAFGRLDHLVCNAGITRDAMIWKMTEEAWDQVIDVNLKGCFAYCRAAAVRFRKQQHGRIVNISSINGMRGKAGQSNYAASKAGIMALTRTLARELGPKGVNVNCVAPGMVRTGMAETLPPAVLEKAIGETALGRIAEPEDVARVVVFLCTEGARHITGEVIRVDGGQWA